MAAEDALEFRANLQRRFSEFLQGTYEEWNPSEAVNALYDDAEETFERRLDVDVTVLRRFDPSLWQRLLNSPSDSLPAFEDALKDFCKAGNFGDNAPAIQKRLQIDDEMFVNLTGEFGAACVSPKELLSPLLNKLVKVYGIVTKCSLVRPKVVKSVHYCDQTKEYTTKEYHDVTSLTKAPTSAVYPTRDPSGNLLVTEYGLCKYRDHQLITMQELPETTAPGQMPYSLDIMLENDLVDRIKPGDRVAVVGIYKALAPRASGVTTGVFRAALIANAVEKFTKDVRSAYTRQESTAIRTLMKSRPDDFLDLLAASLAPSIHGHEVVKKGLVLQLVGGLEKNLESGGHLRGDINALLVGDPGVAKSQMLRAVMNVAPHAVSTSGRGSSGVGLTAAVTTDQETGEKRLEAGAMVLADRGTVCIDEFDKMSEVDRVAIHEVMEQQTVTIAKAGIHTSLNARCSVLAAANPLYGTYDTSVPITRNVNLPDSLLSRFDLLFIIRDNMTPQQDRVLAQHVLGQHRYRPVGDDGFTEPAADSIHDWLQQQEDEEDEEATVRTRDGQPSLFVKYDVRLHGARKAGRGGEVLRSSVVKKFMCMVRARYTMQDAGVDIDEAAEAAMVSYFTQLRARSVDSPLPVTARTLETIIRLSTAACKLRLDFVVTEEDVAVARSILEHVFRPIGGDHDDDEEAGGAEAAAADRDDGASPAPKRRRTSRRSTPRGGAAAQGAADDGNADDNNDDDDDMDGGDGGDGAGAGPSSRAAGGAGGAGPSSQRRMIQVRGTPTAAQLGTIYHSIVEVEDRDRNGMHKIETLQAVLQEEQRLDVPIATLTAILKDLSDDTKPAARKGKGKGPAEARPSVALYIAGEENELQENFFTVVTE